MSGRAVRVLGSGSPPILRRDDHTLRSVQGRWWMLYVPCDISSCSGITLLYVGQRYENWAHNGLDYVDSLFTGKGAENFLAHKSRIEKMRKEFFGGTTAYLQAEPYNIHDTNALGLYLNDVKSYITGDEGMCLAGYLRKTGAEIIRFSKPKDFRLKASLVRIGNLQEGKTGLVIKVAI